MANKTFTAPLRKAAADGTVTAVFATLNLVDHDGDVTLPGAFGRQEVSIEHWGHNYQQPPVGAGTITEEGDRAILRGKFFMNTASGADHYRALVETPGAEWSYSFAVTKSRRGTWEGQSVRLLEALVVSGVSPVYRGAGIGTGTLALKGRRNTADLLADFERQLSGDGRVWLPIGRQKTTAQLRAELEQLDAEWKALAPQAAPPRKQTRLAAWHAALVSEGHSPILAAHMVQAEIEATAAEILNRFPMQYYWQPDAARRMAVRVLNRSV